MPYEKLHLPGTKSEILSWANHPFSIDEQKMISNVSRLPCVFKHIALMPDAHLGKGSMVGSVIATKNAVIPSTVGVDIGCGMMALKTPFKSGVLDGKLKDIRMEIEKRIPVGFNFYKPAEIPESTMLWKGWEKFNFLHEGVQDRKYRAMSQLGTLGGGNHFIEVCIDQDNMVWLMLHSGSRNIGKEIAERHIHTAKGLWKLNELPDPDLAYFIFGTEEFRCYFHDLMWAQEYAMENRYVIMIQIQKIFNDMFNNGHPLQYDYLVNCHHNYVQWEDHFGEKVLITRKGAICARKGWAGIIPGSMGAKSFIVRGKGLAESFDSCAHGAGRILSRTAAKKKFTTEDLEAQTQGIECRKDKDILDEIPAAYKSIDQVMKNQEDLVEVLYELKQVICVKG